MRIRGMLFGLIIYFLSLGMSTFFGCTLKDSEEEKMTIEGPRTATERTHTDEIDLEPNDMIKKMLWFQGA